MRARAYPLIETRFCMVTHEDMYLRRVSGNNRAVYRRQRQGVTLAAPQAIYPECPEHRSVLV